MGETLKSPATTEEVQALLKRIGVDGVRYEEIFITSFDGDVLGLYDHLGEYESIDELNHLAHVLSDLDQSDIEKFEAVIDSGEYTGSVHDLINLAQNLDCYGRQSVDRKDSISIESQIEFCKYELRGGNFRKYTDKGYSGKNTDRPKFQEMMADIRRGLIKRVVVYKLDRISRSILDFATMMETFQEYNVEFVSSTEKFDTSTPMGRAMLNICIVFAQLERETIQKRVTDAYYSRCQHGFHMSGAAPYGFQLEPTTIEGIRTKNDEA